MLRIIKKYKYLLTILLILLVVGLVILRKNKLDSNIVNNIESIDNIELVKVSKEEDIEVIEYVKVDIKGEVNNPGVYELKVGNRVSDVIDIAGGLTDNANTSLINLSKKLEDEMVIIIYSNEEVKNSNIKEVETVFKVIEKECVCPNIKNDSCVNDKLDNNKESSNKDSEENNIKPTGKININTASLEELMSIKGIGESKANDIISYRKTNKFNTIEDIKNVSGIGDALFDKIKESISV